MTRWMLSIWTALALAACAATSPQGPAEGGAAFFSAPVTGANALFPVAARSAQLGRVDFSTGGRRGDLICVRARDVRPLQPLVAPSLAAMRGAGPIEFTRAPRDYSRGLNDAAFRVLLTQDAALAQQAVATLRTHADQNAWLPPNPNGTAGSVVIEGMGPMLPAWQILRQARTTTDADRAAIDPWIGRLAARADERETDNNAATYRGANNMLLGLMTGDGGRYARGRSAVVAQIGGMRPDGSFPLEVERGRGALQNQSRNIGFIVYASDIAVSKGDGLWSAEVDGRSVRTAIRFFLDAAEDNALVDRYASANIRPPDDAPVFRPNDQLDPFNGATKSWANSFVQRFPGEPLSADLRSSMKIGSRVSNDVTGGNSSCYASRL